MDQSTVVDISGLLDIGIKLGGAVIAALLVVAYRRLSVWAGVSLEEKDRAAIDQAIANGIGLAVQRASEAGRNIARVDVQSRMLAEIYNYAAPKVPDALARFGITPDGLKERIKARLGASDLVPLPTPPAGGAP